MAKPSDKNKNKNERNIKRDKARQLMEGRAESKFRSNRGAEEIAQLEALIDDLQHAYQLYFSGISNIDPSDKRMKVNHLIAKLHEMKITNPRLKFKLQSLLGRWVTLKNYWDRILREIEKGTFKRTLARNPATTAQRNKGKWRSYYSEMKEPPESWKDESTSAPDQWKDQQTLTAKPNGKRAPDSWKSAENSQSTLNENSLTVGQTSQNGATSTESVLRKIEEVRKSLSLPPVNKERLAKTIEAQRQRIKQKYAADDVDFKVEVKNGKIVLKPVPIKKRK